MAAAPTKIDVIRDYDFTIYGDFGNPAACTNGGMLYIKSSHPQYKEMYAAALTAFATKQKISAYVHGCERINWYASTANSFNTVYYYSALAIQE